MIQPRLTRYGSIDCIVVDGGAKPRHAVVICHGYGASGSDLAGLSPEWIRLLGDRADAFRFVFPEAPQTLEELGMPDGHAWWPINMMQLAELMQTNQFDQLHDKEPPGMQATTTEICRTITAVMEDLGGAESTLTLGGFSQGAMLTMNAALCGEMTAPKMLFQFSGTLVCQPAWQSRLDRLSGTKVYQSHGTFDPVLPFSSAQSLRDLLSGGGVDVHFHAFEGPHTIDPETVAITAQMLGELEG